MKNINNPALITVVVPVYNAERTITRCIDSILKQTFDSFVILVINDGSTDNSQSIIEEKYILNPKITIINQVNCGVSHARNVGIKNSKTDYIAFVDSDDYLEPNYLSELMKGFVQKKSVDLSVCGIIYKLTNENKKSSYKTNYYNNEDFLHFILQDNSAKGYLWNKLWKTKIIKHYRIKFDNSVKVAEDMLFTIRYLAYVREVYVSEVHCYDYCLNENSISDALIIKKDFNYVDTNLDYIDSMTKMLDLIPVEDFLSKRIIESNIVFENINFIRKLDLNGDINKYKFCVKKLQKYNLKMFFIILGNNKIKKRLKLVYIVSIFFRKVLTIIDKIKKC